MTLVEKHFEYVTEMVTRMKDVAEKLSVTGACGHILCGKSFLYVIETYLAI